MLDLAKLPSEAFMHMSRCNPKAEGSGLCWDVTLSMAVEDETEAQIINKYIPGASSAFAAEHSKGSASVTGGFDIARVEIADSEGEHIASAHAEVRQAKLNVKKESGTLIISVRVYGLVEDAAMSLAYNLDTHINIKFSEQSGSAPSPTEEIDKNCVGRLLTASLGDQVICGIVAEQAGSVVNVATLESDDYVTVDMSVVSNVSTIRIEVKAGSDLREMLLKYIDRCDSANVKSSWTHVVQAVGELFVEDNTLMHGDGWLLTDAVFDHAFSIASVN